MARAKRKRRRSGLGWTEEQHKARGKSSGFELASQIHRVKNRLQRKECEHAMEELLMAAGDAGYRQAHADATGKHSLILRATPKSARTMRNTDRALRKLGKQVLACYRKFGK